MGQDLINGLRYGWRGLFPVPRPQDAGLVDICFRFSSVGAGLFYSYRWKSKTPKVELDLVVNITRAMFFGVIASRCLCHLTMREIFPSCPWGERGGNGRWW